MALLIVGEFVIDHHTLRIHAENQAGPNDFDAEFEFLVGRDIHRGFVQLLCSVFPECRDVFARVDSDKIVVVESLRAENKPEDGISGTRARRFLRHRDSR